MRSRTPRNEMLRRARQHARDERALPVAIPVCGGWARVRCAKSLLYHLTNDQAIDIIAGLSESDTREADLKQLDDAGIVQTTSALTTSAEPRATADLGAAESADSNPSEPTSTPTPPPSAPLEGSSLAGAVVEALPSAAASAPSSKRKGSGDDVVRDGVQGRPAQGGGVVEPQRQVETGAPEGAQGPHGYARDGGERSEAVGLDRVRWVPAPSPEVTGRPAASELLGCSSGVSPRAEPVEPTSTPPGPAADAGVAVCDPTANAEQTAPPRTRKPRSDKGRKRGPKITATPEVSGTVAPDAVQGEVGSVTAEPVTSNHYAGGLPGSILDRASKGDLAAQADLAKLEAWLTDEEFERAPLAAEALPITTAAAFAEDMGALQADLEAMPVAEAVATSISDDATAERIIARILDREAQRKRIAIQAEAMDRELANDIRGLAWRFGIPLEEWARRNLRGKARSHKTLLGTAGFAKIAARWSVEDARAVEAWALAQDDPEKFGRYGFALEPAAVLAYAKATGEAIPGLKLSAERETFYLKGDVRVDVTKARSAPALPEPGNPEEE